MANLSYEEAKDISADDLLAILISGTLPDGTTWDGMPTTGGGPSSVEVTSSALPTGAATSAKQDTGNTSLANLDAWNENDRAAVSTVASATDTATLSSVAVSASSVQLLAANSSRTGVIFHNNSNATLYVKFGSTATASIGGYTYQIQPGATLTLPEAGQKQYTGRIDGIWSSASGNGVSITELN